MSPVPHGCRWHASTKQHACQMSLPRCSCVPRFASPPPSLPLPWPRALCSTCHAHPSPQFSACRTSLGFASPRMSPAVRSKCAPVTAAQVSMTSGVPDAVSCRAPPRALTGCCIVVPPVPPLAAFTQLPGESSPRHICYVLSRMWATDSRIPGPERASTGTS